MFTRERRRRQRRQRWSEKQRPAGGKSMVWHDSSSEFMDRWWDVRLNRHARECGYLL